MAHKSFGDRVSSTMGSFLLKGYALLDEHCKKCQTPLMRDRQSKTICVACSLRENDESTSALTEVVPPVPNEFADQTDLLEREELMESDSPNTRRVLQDKIAWATGLLQASTSVSECTQLCSMIHMCFKTLKILTDLK